MNPKPTAAPAPGFTLTLGDIYYVLFRHIKMIIILIVLTLIAAWAVGPLSPQPFFSEAKLMIKYVHENKAPAQIGDQMVSPDVGGANVINSELQIITSMDLSSNVAYTIGPARILGKSIVLYKSPLERQIAAANTVRSGLIPIQNGSDVITLVYYHSDPTLVQSVLAEIISAYLKKHEAVHHPEFVDFLEKQIEDVRARRTDTETLLRKIKREAGIVSLDDSTRTYIEMSSKIQSEIYDTEAELGSYDETIQTFQHMLPKPTAPRPASTNAPIPVKVVLDFKKKTALLANLQAQEDDMMMRMGLTTNNPLIKAKQNSIDSTQKTLDDLTAKYPDFQNFGEEQQAPDPGTQELKRALGEEMLKAGALAAKYRVLTNQLARVEATSTGVGNYEAQITELTRAKEVEDTEFAYFTRRLEESKVNEEVGPGTSNIAEVEAPTPVGQDLSSVKKMVRTILMGGLAIAFGLPFLIELVLDRSVKRPQEASKLGVPFFLNIPKLNFNGKPRRLKNTNDVPLLPAPGGGEGQEAVEPGAGALATRERPVEVWDENHTLRPFHETLRDRLMNYFEMINLTHKPKLVAVTSCRNGAGVTSTAAGLASALSETRDGNVLLVDMNGRDGGAHHFYKGKLACGLDEVLEKGETRENAFVHEHLYVAQEQHANDKLPRILPKRFSHLLPKMKASDFDYIIFDMPPINQVSITPRLARFMDMVLLVVESEKTDKDVAARAVNLLAESKTNVGVVLNKSRSYVPRRLQQEI